MRLAVCISFAFVLAYLTCGAYHSATPIDGEFCPSIHISDSSDTTYFKGSGIKFPKLDNHTITDLQLLGHVWGFLKYHHPSLAKGQKNWDYELFNFLPSYLKSETSRKRNQLLLDWITKLGEVDRCQNCEFKSLSDSAKIQPNIDWVNDFNLSKELKVALGNIFSAKRDSTNHYVSLVQGSGNPIFSNENPYSQFNVPDEGYRLLALFRYWSMIQYFFPYKYHIEEDWSVVLKEFVPKIITADNRIKYRLVLLELIGRIHDTHANILGDSTLEIYKGKYIAPLQVKFIENKLVVVDYFDLPKAKKLGIEVGDIIEAIDDVPINQIVKERLSYYPASNYSTKLRDIARDILRSNKLQSNVSLLRGETIINKTITRFPLFEIGTDKDWAYNMPNTPYKLLGDSIGYLYLGNLKNSQLPEIFIKFNSTKGIIIDIRNYPRESTIFMLSEYLLSSQVEFVKFTIGSVKHPGGFYWRHSIPKIGRSNENPYKGKVIILVNELTQSHAEYVAMALRTVKNSSIVGSTTAGSNGNLSRIVLPGNIRTFISGIGVYYPDGRETQRVGIIPDIMVEPTINGIHRKEDEVLNRAIDMIKE